MLFHEHTDEAYKEDSYDARHIPCDYDDFKEELDGK